MPPARVPVDDRAAIARAQLPAGLEARTAAPLLRAVGDDPVRARAAWAFIHGLTLLERNQRLPSDELTEPAWQVGIQQFTNATHDEGRLETGARVEGRL